MWKCMQLLISDTNKIEKGGKKSHGQQKCYHIGEDFDVDSNKEQRQIDKIISRVNMLLSSPTGSSGLSLSNQTLMTAGQDGNAPSKHRENKELWKSHMKGETEATCVC